MMRSYISLPPPDWRIRDLAYSLMAFPFSVKKKAEAVIRDLYGIDHILLTNLGRTSLIAGLKAADLAGHGVLIPTLVCPTVIRSVLKVGCRPVLADVEDNLHVSAKTLEAAYTQDVKAVLMPHLYGLHCPVEEIKAWAEHRKLFLIDDAAQAVGLQYQGRYLGTFGNMGILSFGPFKSIGISRGGVLMSHDAGLIERAKKFPFDPEPSRDIVKRLISCIVKLHYRPYFLAVKNISAPTPPPTPPPPPPRNGEGSSLISPPASTPPPTPPRNGEGSSLISPPALSGKGGGGLGEENFALSRIEAHLIYRVLKRADSIFSKRREVAKKFVAAMNKEKYEPVG
ncbi:MAG: hypothetical protein BWK80_04265, partial [Desulfobacteraceae bacterium IS3]